LLACISPSTLCNLGANRRCGTKQLISHYFALRRMRQSLDECIYLANQLESALNDWQVLVIESFADLNP
jgi:hypothetical protein